MNRIWMGLLLLFGACTDAAAQHDPKMVQDTSRAWRRNPQPPATPQDRPPASWLKTDTAVYNNDLYWKGIRSAEYQNREPKTGVTRFRPTLMLFPTNRCLTGRYCPTLRGSNALPVSSFLFPAGLLLGFFGFFQQ